MCSSSTTGVNSCLCLISRQDTDIVCSCPCGVSGSPGKEHSWFIPESSPSGFFLGSLDSKLCPWAKARASILLPKWSSTWEAIIIKVDWSTSKGHRTMEKRQPYCSQRRGEPLSQDSGHIVRQKPCCHKPLVSLSSSSFFPGPSVTIGKY